MADTAARLAALEREMREWVPSRVPPVLTIEAWADEIAAIRTAQEPYRDPSERRPYEPSGLPKVPR